ncbi:MAG: group I intron-associated PD-(D/E)XK endonuclease [Methylovulum sp.]|uniref:group I intron-associated PD-(D/E)XK endonuclease n=1 Tax=Methylovulum sp. TaxID=1916980 RepID=UPI0026274F62|nr:group I intron-associated PD-(D/E)XK endonuclease [Methylovulum sp.]MDD2722808.1 group I intron-associated PD-(D/E)XK endonuclease [Methylovulum sp.]MDD5125531.1 group I intron-associated PD-(D/E)XK endonuclease [Methylovulum sp.]
MLDNPNKKGTLGEIAVCKELLKLGFDVFVEVGSDSKVDWVVLDENYVCYKVQIKATYSNNETVEVYSKKSCLNPKYNSTYQVQQIDAFAVYVIDKDIVFYVSAKEILKNSKRSKFRLMPSKNGQQLNVRYVQDYLDFKKALRDLTPHTQTVETAGDEKVQTTTF